MLLGDVEKSALFSQYIDLKKIVSVTEYTK